MNIWCLFSIENNYDQPEHNLAAWWPTKPDILTVANALQLGLPAAVDADTVAIIKLWDGQEVDIRDTLYRLRKIEAGVVTEKRTDD